MIDFLKILVLDRHCIERLYKHPLLTNDSAKMKYENAKYSYRKVTYRKEYKGIFFDFSTANGKITKLEILIKPHYYFNGGIHNANDFTVQNSINTLTEIINLFNLPAKILPIINNEFGVNFQTPYPSRKVILYVLYQGRNIFQNSRDDLKYSKIASKSKKDGTAYKYKMIKFYDKYLDHPEYALPNTLRFEVKSKESKYAREQAGIKTLADLLKPETYDKLGNILLNEWDNVLILDRFNELNNLNDKEKERLRKYLDPITWDEYLQGSKNLFAKHKRQYNELLDKTGQNIHKVIKDIMREKIKQLTEPAKTTIIY